MTLTIQDLGALGELLGSVAVLVTSACFSFTYRSFPGWWEGIRSLSRPEFIEFAEEQRSKAA